MATHKETTMKRDDDDLQPGVEFLQAFGDAWNRHDIEALMAAARQS